LETAAPRSLDERRRDPNNAVTGYRHQKARIKEHPEALVGRAIVDVRDMDFGETSYMVEVVRIPNESVWAFVEFHDALGVGHQVVLPGAVTKKIDELIRTTGKRSIRAAGRRQHAGEQQP
jgi:hypothetical protein